MEDTFRSQDETTRQGYYGPDGEQPWDVIKRLGFAAEFAAGNVLKYMKRTKPGQEAHSLASARWYHDRLVGFTLRGHYRDRRHAADLYDRVMGELTVAERARLAEAVAP